MSLHTKQAISEMLFPSNPG